MTFEELIGWINHRQTDWTDGFSPIDEVIKMRDRITELERERDGACTSYQEHLDNCASDLYWTELPQLKAERDALQSRLTAETKRADDAEGVIKEIAAIRDADFELDGDEDDTYQSFQRICEVLNVAGYKYSED